MSPHLAPPDLAECGAELLQVLQEARTLGKEEASSAGSGGCADGAPGGGRGGAGGSSGTLPVAIQVQEPPQGAGEVAPGAGEGRTSGAASLPGVLEAGAACVPASEGPSSAALSAGSAPSIARAPGPAEGTQLHQEGSVTLPPVPAVRNPFDSLRRWTSDDDMPAPPHDASVTERFASMRMASSAALPGRGSGMHRAPLLGASEDEGALAVPPSGGPSPQDSEYADASAGGMRRATSVTLPPMPPVWNPFGGTRRWTEDGAPLALGAAARAGAVGAAGADAAAGPGAGALGALGHHGPAGEAQADQDLVVAAAAPPLPLPPPALPFVAHRHEPFVAAPGEAEPALPPLWPASKPSTPPPPALPFATRLNWGFDSPGASESPAEANADAAAHGNGTLARMPAAVLPVASANGEGDQNGFHRGPGLPAAALLPSRVPPHAPPPAYPFAARARRGFNRRDSTDSTSGELAPVMPPLLPSKPGPAGPEAFPFAARAAEGFRALGAPAEEDRPSGLQASDRAPEQAPEAYPAPSDEVSPEQEPLEEPAELPAAAARPGFLLSGVKRLRGPSSDFRASFEAPAGGSGSGTPGVGASSSKRADFGVGQLRMGRAGGFFWGRRGAAAKGKEGLQMPACHPLWLTFEDASLEEAFRVWHSTQMSKVLLGESAFPRAWTSYVGTLALHGRCCMTLQSDF